MMPSFGSMMRLWPPSTPNPGGCSSRMTVCVTPPGDPLNVPVRSGWPSGRRGMGPAGAAVEALTPSTPARPPGRPSWPAIGTDVAASTMTDAAIDNRRRVRVVMLWSSSVDVEISRPRVMNAQLVEHCGALIIQNPDIFLTLDGHPDRPRPRKHLWIRHGGFVLQRVGVDRRVTLNYLQRIAVEISRHVEPCIAVEVRQVDDERVAFVVAARHAHPRSVSFGRRRRRVERDDPLLVRPLVHEGHGLGCLNDL